MSFFVVDGFSARFLRLRLSPDEFLPIEEIKSERDFENHVLKVIQKVKHILLTELEREFL